MSTPPWRNYTLLALGYLLLSREVFESAIRRRYRSLLLYRLGQPRARIVSIGPATDRL